MRLVNLLFNRIGRLYAWATAARWLTALVICGIMVGCHSQRSLSLRANKVVVRRNAHAYNTRDKALLAETMTTDLIRHCQATPQVNVRSLSDFIAFAESDWAVFPDGELTIDRMVAEGDLVGAFGRFTGTQRSAMGPFPPTDKRVDLDFGAVFRIANGKITELWVTWDNLSALTQLGHWSLSPTRAQESRNETQSLNSRPKITTRADLPRQTYPVSKKLSEFFASREDMIGLTGQVRDDVQDILSSYRITDATLLKDLHRALADAALITGENDIALAELRRVADLEERPAAKLLSGLVPSCAVEAESGLRSEDTHATFRRLLSERVASMPWEAVQEDVEQLKGRTEIVTENFMLGMIETRIAPGAEKAGHISGDTARQFLAWRAAIDVVIPFKQDIVDVLGKIIDRNRVEKKDIWAARKVDLSNSKNLSPVLIGIWDSGVDPSVFGSRMHVNNGETVNGIDDDGNGFVDDVHGIAFSWLGERISGSLAPLSDTDRMRMPELKDRIKGLMDMRAVVSSPEATATKRMLSEMAPDRVGPFMEDFWLFFNFIHGTSVAGIAVDGNPAARLIVSRIEFPHETLPPPWFEEHARAHAAEFQATVDYFRKAGVRVVNMSWGMTPQVFEKGWEANGIGESAEKRARDAAVLFGIMKDGLTRAIESAPNILFVVAAGNADYDSTFELVLPASIDRPNVLTVGAVDKAGDVASFTSFGPSVDIYANGVEIDCLLPGGEHLTSSGTSLAAPQVLNLAAKLLAVNPKLAGARVAELIRQGSERSADRRVLLVHPKQSLQLARSDGKFGGCKTGVDK